MNFLVSAYEMSDQGSRHNLDPPYEIRKQQARPNLPGLYGRM